MITFLVIWNVLLTGGLVGLLFRTNGHEYQLNNIAIKNLREGMVMQDNEAARQP